jgi:hypothetical protein
MEGSTDNAGHGDFDPSFIDGSRVDPLAPPRTVDFDWADVFRRLGEAPGEDGNSWAKAASALKEVLFFLVEPAKGVRPSNCDKRLNLIGRRAVALAWVFDPDLFSGESLSCLARRLGLSPRSLAELTGTASRITGIRNRAQAHAAGMFKPTKPTAPQAKDRPATVEPRNVSPLVERST